MNKTELLHGLTKWHEELMANGETGIARIVDLTKSILVEEIEHERKK